MKKKYITLLLYSFFLAAGSLYGFGEKTLVLGAAATWKAAETRVGITELTALRPYPVLALSSARTGGPSGDAWYAVPAGTSFAAGTPAGTPAALDMALSFDEGRPDRFSDRAGHYTVSADSGLAAADRRLARAGNGAALFGGESPLVIVPRTGEALLYQNQRLRDFTIEFWLYPVNMENGEQIFSWTASRRAGGDTAFQRIQCAAGRNRLQWAFRDFFSSPGGGRRINLSLESSPVLPKTWSHHLVRFNADTGLLEYLMNGRLESAVHATVSGAEGGEVYTPVIGGDSRLVLGSRFTGLMDEVRIHSRYIESAALRKYPPRGGRMETRPLDLGQINSAVLRIEASGGRTSQAGPSGIGAGPVRNEYAGYGRFRFADDSALQFFIRAGDNPYRWTESDWRSFEPGGDIPGVRGRFVQLAAVFYPSGDGEATPYLDEVRIIYLPDTPPHPPSMVSAVARDGAVDLSWRAGPDPDTAGYLVYYGTSRGEYFGEDAGPGASPINAGKRTSLHIDGLRNGTLYYFAVAAYDSGNPADAPTPQDAFHCGEFSREVSARPLRMTP
jgi:hypothetical protein